MAADLSVVASAAAEQVATVGAGRVLVAGAARGAQDALLGVLDAVVGRFVDVHQVLFAQQRRARLPLGHHVGFQTVLRLERHL